MANPVSRRSCIALAAAALVGCAESRTPLRSLQLTLKRDVEFFQAVVRSFAEREGYWVAERRADDVIGDGMIQLESWRSSIIIARDFLGIRDPTVVISENGMPAPKDMTPVYANDVFEASFYGPTLTLARPLTTAELDELVTRFTQALLSANVAEVAPAE